VSEASGERIGKRADSVGFRETVKEYFGFLVTEAGFLGPEIQSDRAFYYSPEVSIEVVYDEHSRYAMTIASGIVDERNVRAELSCLYVRAGLGPAQRVGSSARTSHALRKALVGQAAALRELMPMLKSEVRNRLLLECHRR
jgi:hypothetical protein